MKKIDDSIIISKTDSNDSQKESAQELFANLHPADIADIIENLVDDKKKELFNRLNVSTASDVILEIDNPTREHILESIKPEKLTHLVEEMESDDAADLIRELPREEADNILKNLDKEDSDEVRKILRHDQDSAGGIMQIETFSVREGMLVEDVIVKFIAEAESISEISDIHFVYVLDFEGVLVGSIPVASLLLHKPTKSITDFMDKNLITVKSNVDQEEVARIFKKYDMVSLAVVDDYNKLIGRILVDDIVDIFDEEASEDMLRIAGIYQDEHIFDSAFRSVRMRFPWLLLNLVTAVLAASIVGAFENTIHSFVILAAFMPVIAGMGGIAGSQALAVTIRGLALGELSFANTRKALSKGISVGTLNGIIAGVIMAVIAYYWEGNLVLSFIILVTMFLNIFVANLFGILIPLCLKGLKIDPAVASSVFLASLTDCLGFFSFLGLSTLLIKYLVH